MNQRRCFWSPTPRCVQGAPRLSLWWKLAAPSAIQAPTRQLAQPIAWREWESNHPVRIAWVERSSAPWRIAWTSVQRMPTVMLAVHVCRALVATATLRSRHQTIPLWRHWWHRPKSSPPNQRKQFWNPTPHCAQGVPRLSLWWKLAAPSAIQAPTRQLAQPIAWREWESNHPVRIAWVERSSAPWRIAWTSVQRMPTVMPAAHVSRALVATATLRNRHQTIPLWRHWWNCPRSSPPSFPRQIPENIRKWTKWLAFCGLVLSFKAGNIYFEAETYASCIRDLVYCGLVKFDGMAKAHNHKGHNDLLIRCVRVSVGVKPWGTQGVPPRSTNMITYNGKTCFSLVVH